jgi:uncharacterized protein
MYQDLFAQMKKMLGQLDKWLVTGAEFAKSRSFEPNLLLAARLAPDQFPLSRQVQIACDTAKLGASRITGKAAPAQADDEQTLDELRARIASVIAYLDSFTAADFATAASAVITQPRWEGRTMTGHDYFIEHVVPNFYFHATHVYALLRHSGVVIGKRDFLGALTQTKPAS